MKLRTRLLLTLIAIAVLLAGPAIYALSKLAELREIAGEQEAFRYRLEAAMRRLFDADKIHLEPYGAPSRKTFMLATRGQPK